MTLKSWREEFMPKMPSKRMSKIKAIEHSLRKWKGLTKSNLKKHDMVKISYWIETDVFENYKTISEQYLNIDAESCALCVRFYDDDTSVENEECKKCPLFKTLGNPCDIALKSPYRIWKNQDNPRPMIRALEKTLERELLSGK